MNVYEAYEVLLQVVVLWIEKIKSMTKRAKLNMIAETIKSTRGREHEFGWLYRQCFDEMREMGLVF